MLPTMPEAAAALEGAPGWFAAPQAPATRGEAIAYLATHPRYGMGGGRCTYSNDFTPAQLGLGDPAHVDRLYRMMPAVCGPEPDPRYSGRPLAQEAAQILLTFTEVTGWTAVWQGPGSSQLCLYPAVRAAGRVQAAFTDVDAGAAFQDWPDAMLDERALLVRRFDKACDQIRDTFAEYAAHALLVPVQGSPSFEWRVPGRGECVPFDGFTLDGDEAVPFPSGWDGDDTGE